MNIFCLKEFQNAIDALKRKNSYQDVESAIYDHFHAKSESELLTGIRLNLDDLTPYLKKRLKGRGGYRIYYLLIIRDENVYLMGIHPKTGKLGKSTLDKTTIKFLYKQVLGAIRKQDLLRVEFNPEKKSLDFVALEKVA